MTLLSKSNPASHVTPAAVRTDGKLSQARELIAEHRLGRAIGAAADLSR